MRTASRPVPTVPTLRLPVVRPRLRRPRVPRPDGVTVAHWAIIVAVTALPLVVKAL